MTVFPSRLTLAQAKQIVCDLEPGLIGKEDDPSFLAAMCCPPPSWAQALRLSFSSRGYDEAIVKAIEFRMREAELWAGDKALHAHWLQDGKIQPAPFWTDVLVAEGSAMRKRTESGYRYFAAKHAPADSKAN